MTNVCARVCLKFHALSHLHVVDEFYLSRYATNNILNMLDFIDARSFVKNIRKIYDSINELNAKNRYF